MKLSQHQMGHKRQVSNLRDDALGFKSNEVENKEGSLPGAASVQLINSNPSLMNTDKNFATISGVANDQPD